MRHSSLSRNSIRRTLDALEARDVPAVLDVTFVGAEATANGALFQQAGALPADSGQFNTFLSILDNQASFEHGYNTDARPFQLDQQGDLSVTHALQLADIPTVTVNGTVYREFLLHVDEGPRIRNRIVTLDQLRFYVAPVGDLTGYNSQTQRLSGLNAVWDLDAGSNNTVRFNDAVNGAGGKGDAVVLIPDSAFAGAAPTDFIYLYSRFGGRVDAQGGAEEWGVRQVPPPPTGGTLSGFVYFDADNDGVREPDGNEDFVPEYGLEGVSLHLTGTDHLGNAVDLWAVTDANGFYWFGDLAAGTYMIVRPELAPESGFFDGLNTVGSAGGTSIDSNTEPDINGPDRIFDIVLATGAAGTDYNFGMLGGGGGTPT